MSAGSSPDTGTDVRGFIIPITEPPVVEIDTEATAAYIRLRETKVARTEPFASDSGFVMIDFDSEGNVIGVEVVGQHEFSIRELIKSVPVTTTDAILDRTRYIAAKPSDRASAVAPTQREAIERAKEIAPDAAVHVERVRHTSEGKPDKWRNP